MHDVSRFFLLSLVAVPACHERSARPTFEQACAQYFGKYTACYAEVYETGDAAGSEDAYDPAQYCEEYASYFSAGPAACVQAMADHWSCLSNLDCAEFLDFEARGKACLPTLQQGNARCPEYFGYCQIVTTSGGGGECSESHDACLDGKVYGVACTTQDAMLACDCTVNEATVASFTVAGSCDTADYRASAAAECSFPDGVFEAEDFRREQSWAARSHPETATADEHGARGAAIIARRLAQPLAVAAWRRVHDVAYLTETAQAHPRTVGADEVALRRALAAK